MGSSPGHVKLADLCIYLSLQPLVQPASNHASGVGLNGDDGPEPVSERPAHQVAPTASLEACDPLTGHVIRCTQLPGPNQSLQAREACSHLKGHREGRTWQVKKRDLLSTFSDTFSDTNGAGCETQRCSSQLHSSSYSDTLSMSSGSTQPTSSSSGS